MQPSDHPRKGYERPEVARKPLSELPIDAMRWGEVLQARALLHEQIDLAVWLIVLGHRLARGESVEGAAVDAAHAVNARRALFARDGHP